MLLYAAKTSCMGELSPELLKRPRGASEHRLHSLPSSAPARVLCAVHAWHMRLALRHESLVPRTCWLREFAKCPAMVAPGHPAHCDLSKFRGARSTSAVRKLVILRRIDAAGLPHFVRVTFETVAMASPSIVDVRTNGWWLVHARLRVSNLGNRLNSGKGDDPAHLPTERSWAVSPRPRGYASSNVTALERQWCDCPHQ